jgi:hypothetical protein
MGRGNYLPSQEMGDHEMVYVDGFFDALEYRYLIQVIRDSLPKSFDENDKRLVHECEAIASSALLDVCVADNEWSTAVFVVPAEGLVEYPSKMNLAYHHLNPTARNLFKKLIDAGYTLSVRASAWTSGKYVSDIGN